MGTFLGMKKVTSWTVKLDGGVKRETRVRTSMHGVKWQFKRSDEERWDYDSKPTREDWDMLEDILSRRAGRGRAVELLAAIRTLRKKEGC